MPAASRSAEDNVRRKAAADEAAETSAARAQHYRPLQPGVGVDQFQPDGPPVVVVVESQLDVGHTQASKVEVAMRPAFAVENSDVEQLRWLADDESRAGRPNGGLR